jgi:hypothetical protein
MKSSSSWLCYDFLMKEDSEEVMMPSLTDVKMFWRTFLQETCSNLELFSNKITDNEFKILKNVIIKIYELYCIK